LQALELELERLSTPQEIDTLFVGGGTPTHLPPAELQRLLQLLTSWLPLSPGYEFTVEANPTDVYPEVVDVLTSMGVGRVSLGAQSFDGQKLKLLERNHTCKEIEASAQLLRQAGLHFSLDLIFGVPDESMDKWRTDLDNAIRLEPQHLSTYALTYERGARFWARQKRGELQALSNEAEADLFELAIEQLSQAGFEHYEVSNFARRQHACRHNLNYWQGGTYFAFGPGAASHIAGRRRVNHGSTTTYLRRMLANESPIAESELLSDQESAQERLVFGLRQLAGVAAPQFLAETGYTIDDLAGKAIERLVAADLLEWENERLRVTHAGLLVCDAIAAELLTPA
jgi:oxygen-independent coproporphyrinogen-3 oxidase